MRSAPLSLFIAGVSSAVLYLVGGSANSMLAALPMMLLMPAFPLFWVGFQHGARLAGLSALIALLIIAPYASAPALGVYVALIAVPSFLFIWRFLHPLGIVQTQEPSADDHSVNALIVWTPLSHILLTVVYAACLAAIFTALWLAGQPQESSDYTGMQGYVYGVIMEVISQSVVQPEMANAMHQEAESLTYMLPAGMIWFTMSLLTVNGWLAHRLVSASGQPLRPVFHADNAQLPPSLLAALCLAGLAAFIGGPVIAYLGQLTFLLLLLPYFFSAMFAVHRTMQHWPMKEVWLTGLYGLSLLVFWPALCIAVYAVLKHCLSVGRTLTSV